MRAKKSLWPQIEATFKQIDIAATELECFQALQKQEQLAASHRINNLWTEVQKQKELEKTLQQRYGDLTAELERIQIVMEQCRVQAQKQEEIEAKNRELESTENAADEINVQGTENCNAVPLPCPVDDGSAISVGSPHAGIADQPADIAPDQATSSSKNDMDMESCEKQMTHDTDTKLPDAPAAEDNCTKVVEGNNTEDCIENKEATLDISASEEISSTEGNRENQDIDNPDKMGAVNQRDSSIQETTPLDQGDKMEVEGNSGEEVN